MFERVLDGPAKEVLEQLKGIEPVRPFYLAGGTAFALQLGHRRSIDLDWFTPSDFDPDTLIAELDEIGTFELLSKDVGTLVALLNGLEVSFFRYKYPLLFPTVSFRGLQMASWQDILCMKIVAIGQRSEKRDYVDVYFGLRNGITLRQLFDLLKEKYASVKYSEYHLATSLSYFREVEKQPMPSLTQNVTWPEIREYLTQEIRRLEIR